MFFNFLRLNQKLYAGFGIIILLMVSVFGYTYINYDKQVQAVADNLHTQEVIRESDLILESLLNMETGARGYAITGKEEFLDPYVQGITDYNEHYQRILELTSDTRSQQELLNQMHTKFLNWFDWETNQVIKSRRDVNAGRMSMAEVIAIVQTDRGKNEMDGLRAILAKITSYEQQVLEVRGDRLDATERNTAMVMTFGGVIVALLAVGISFFTSYSVSNPLKQLIQAIERITQSNYREPIKLKTDKELGVVISHFNRMQAAIQSREVELKRKNEALKEQMIEVNEANKLKSQFLANMSHELRTPLNSIIGFTNRVIKKSGADLPVVQRDNLVIVRDEAVHLLELINSLLDYSKIEAGRMEIHPEPFDLLKVIQEVYIMTQNLRDDKPIQYLMETGDEASILVTSDRMKVKQILINLLSNAFKYSEEGTVTVSVGQEGAGYRIDVRDEGIGIAPDHLVSIFDEFRQIDGSYTRKVGGTGLGLSITKKFVEMLGGTIEVVSQPEIGSCFTVRIPAHWTEEKAAEPERPDVRYHRRVVCVDDDPNVHKLFKQYLDEHGFETISLDGQGDVVQQIVELAPDVVILDIMLPQRDGWEILTDIKDHQSARNIPIIMASVLSERNLAYRMRADEYLIKPVTQEELLGTITRTLSKVEGIDVLVADDDDHFLNLIGQFLKEEHISCRLAGDGIEAVRQMNLKKPDMVILDLMMPKMDGFAVLETIRSTESLSDIPVVVVTAKDLTKGERQQLLDLSSLIIQKSGTMIDQVMQALIEKIKEKSNEPKNFAG
ncbi:response regulator [Paenibacillus sp. HN-1]|uniref:response regulator n=1 Tax=Paenibacillus TaxID=44249 RepID=UPI001CA9E71F|nr:MULTISPECIES: response regulator [Paenibacillus]MBY9077406.1 response regulator [Paenibacillus sp. CGMCC 1.18879]MBY9087485.1 response regulator [Paenibacillus sinensis]